MPYHSCTRYTVRVTNCNCTTINVQYFIGDTKLVTTIQNLNSKSFTSNKLSSRSFNSWNNRNENSLNSMSNKSCSNKNNNSLCLNSSSNSSSLNRRNFCNKNCNNRCFKNSKNWTNSLCFYNNKSC